MKYDLEVVWFVVVIFGLLSGDDVGKVLGWFEIGEFSGWFGGGLKRLLREGNCW